MRHDLDGKTGPEAHTLIALAGGLANGVHTLLPRCSAGVVVGIRGEWQLVAQRGPIDVSGRWLAAVASQVHASKLPQQTAGILVAPFSSLDVRALLVVVGESEEQVDPWSLGVVRPLLDAGGPLLDRALAAQERDRAVRRTMLGHQEQGERPTRSVADLERALASLWPDGAAHFYERTGLEGATWSTRRLVRAACECGEPAVGRTTANVPLLPWDFAYQIAIPMPERDGAMVVESYAAGEEPDADSLATAVVATQRSAGPTRRPGRLLHAV